MHRPSPAIKKENSFSSGRIASRDLPLSHVDGGQTNVAISIMNDDDDSIFWDIDILLLSLLYVMHAFSSLSLSLSLAGHTLHYARGKGVARDDHLLSLSLSHTHTHTHTHTLSLSL